MIKSHKNNPLRMIKIAILNRRNQQSQPNFDNLL